MFVQFAESRCIHDEANSHPLLVSVDLDAQQVAAMQVVTSGEHLRYGNDVAGAEPLCDVEGFRRKIRQLKRAKRRIGENVDPKKIEVFTRKIWQRNQTANERCRCDDAFSSLNGRKKFVGQIIRRRIDLQLRFSGDDIDGRGKCPTGTSIGELDCEKNCNSDGNTQNVEHCQQPMRSDVTQDLPVKETNEVHDEIRLRSDTTARKYSRDRTEKMGKGALFNAQQSTVSSIGRASDS